VGRLPGKSSLAQLRHPEVPRFDQRDEGFGAGTLGRICSTRDPSLGGNTPRFGMTEASMGTDCGFSKARSKNWGKEIAVAVWIPAHG